MRLIDADALDSRLEVLMIRYMSLGRQGVAEDYNFVRTVISVAETIDAVEVVRCKDCKWFEPCEEIEGESWTGYCTYGEFHTDEMDFCSRGERKEE